MSLCFVLDLFCRIRKLKSPSQRRISWVNDEIAQRIDPKRIDPNGNRKDNINLDFADTVFAKSFGSFI